MRRFNKYTSNIIRGEIGILIKFKTNPPKSSENRVNYQTSNKLKLLEAVENR